MSRYVATLTAMVEQLREINPDRVVDRSWEDFAERSQDDMRRGVWMVLPAGIPSYPYEVSDGQFDSDSLRATQHGRQAITVVGQILLPEPATGEDVDLAEFELIHELEQLADAVMTDERTQTLLLRDVQQSQQAERPYAWVVSTWAAMAF